MFLGGSLFKGKNRQMKGFHVFDVLMMYSRLICNFCNLFGIRDQEAWPPNCATASSITQGVILKSGLI